MGKSISFNLLDPACFVKLKNGSFAVLTNLDPNAAPFTGRHRMPDHHQVNALFLASFSDAIRCFDDMTFYPASSRILCRISAK